MTWNTKDNSDPPFITEVKVNPLTCLWGLEPETSRRRGPHCPVQYLCKVWVISSFSQWRDFNGSWNLIYDLTTIHFRRKRKQIWKFTKVATSGLFINGWRAKVLPLESHILSHWIIEIARMPTVWWLRAATRRVSYLMNYVRWVRGTNGGACEACDGSAMTRADEPHDHQHKYNSSSVKNGTATRQTFQLTCYNCYTIRNCCVVSWLCILVLTGLRNQIWERYQ